MNLKYVNNNSQAKMAFSACNTAAEDGRHTWTHDPHLSAITAAAASSIPAEEHANRQPFPFPRSKFTERDSIFHNFTY